MKLNRRQLRKLIQEAISGNAPSAAKTVIDRIVNYEDSPILKNLIDIGDADGDEYDKLYPRLDKQPGFDPEKDYPAYSVNDAGYFPGMNYNTFSLISMVLVEALFKIGLNEQQIRDEIEKEYDNIDYIRGDAGFAEYGSDAIVFPLSGTKFTIRDFGKDPVGRKVDLDYLRSNFRNIRKAMDTAVATVTRGLK